MILLVVIYLAFISLGLPDSLIGAVWPVMHQDLSTKIQYAGFISAFVSMGTIISTFFTGKLRARLKASTITSVSIILTAAGLFIYSSATSLFMVFLGAVPLGLGGGAVDATLNAYVASHYKAKHLSFLHAFWGVGTLIGPIIFGALLSNGGSWRTGYLILAAVQSAIMLSVVFSRPLWSDAKRDMSIKVKAPGFLTVMKEKGVVEAVLAFVLYVGFETTAIMWGGSFLVYAKDFTPDKAAFLSSLFFIGITSSRIVTGFASSHFEDRTLIRTGLATVMASALALIFLPSALSPAALFMIGFGCGPIYPLMMHESSTCFSKEYTAAIIGYQSAFSYIGIVSIPLLYGFLAKAISQNLLPYYVLFFAIALAFTYSRKLQWVEKRIK
jgi:Major Facilitator Superfamily.